MFLDKRERIEVDLPKQVGFIFDILGHNQNLLQFADSKANALLLINSIFIASIGPFFDVLRKGGGNPIGIIIISIFFISSISSILCAFGVIVARRTPEMEKRARNLVFYSNILESPSAEGFVHEFINSDIIRFRETLLINVYDVARIAQDKFAMYNRGQNLTLISCIFWILSLASLLLAF